MAQPSAVAAMAAELNAFNQGAIPLALRLRRLEVRAVIVAGGRDEVAPWRRPPSGPPAASPTAPASSWERWATSPTTSAPPSSPPPRKARATAGGGRRWG